MNSSIQAICFDIGGTLRTGQDIDTRDLAYIRKLQAFIGDQRPAGEFRSLVRAREKQYRRWCKRSLVELSEADLWSQYLLPDLDAGFIRGNAVRLNQMWRESRDKTLLPDSVEILRELARRGYTLAIISNTTSSVEVPALLEENGIRDLFGCVILSTVFGRRKPHPSLFLDAVRQIGIRPQHCAYVGDDLSRDMVGARQAGFGEVVIIKIQGYQKGENDQDDDPQNDGITEMQPDAYITRLNSLLDLYPRPEAIPALQETPRQPEALYDAALSTMWGVDQPIPFNDTFKAARKIGFARFELNHKVSPELYAAWDHSRFYISTVHEPCPAFGTYAERKQGDWMISSLDERRRRKSIDSIKGSIELACKLGSKLVVVHPGSIQCDHSRDNRLRELYRQGRQGTPEYQALAADMRLYRSKEVPPYLERVMQSLSEIIEFSKGSGIAIGLENRYHYDDLPLPDEMELFLDLCRESWFGFQYDVGHAYTLDVLGLVDHSAWLERFGARIVGVHLHDVQGITDHQAPGTGDVDFGKIAAYLPESAFKTLEIGPQASLAELAAGLEVLVKSGCIQKV